MLIALQNKWNKLPLAAKVSTAYAVCSILQKCLSFITLPLFTRLLTTEQYGQLTIYSSWQGILSIFLTLNLAYGSFSTAMIKFENDRDGYISSVEGICVFLTVLFLLIYLPFQTFWNYWFQLPTKLILLMIVEMLCSTAILLWSGKKRFEFKYIGVVSVTLLMALFSPIVAYFLVINHDEKGYARIIGFALVHILIGGAFFVWNAIRGKKVINKIYWKYALSFNIPLLAYYLSQIIFNQINRIMISHMVGTDKAAIFGVAYSLAMVLTFVLNAINNSYVPWFYGKIKEGKMSDNRHISLGIAGFMAVILSVVIWFAPEVIQIMAGSQYVEAIYVVPPVAISLLLLFYAQLFINVEFYYEEKKSLVWASIGAAVVNFILNYFLIKLFGFVAAAYATLVSYIIFAYSNYRAMKNVFVRRGLIDEAYNYKGLIQIFVLFCLTSAVGGLFYDVLIVRIIILIIVLFVIYQKRMQFIRFYKTLKN